VYNTCVCIKNKNTIVNNHLHHGCTAAVRPSNDPSNTMSRVCAIIILKKKIGTIIFYMRIYIYCMYINNTYNIMHSDEYLRTANASIRYYNQQLCHSSENGSFVTPFFTRVNRDIVFYNFYRNIILYIGIYYTNHNGKIISVSLNGHPVA